MLVRKEILWDAKVKKIGAECFILVFTIKKPLAVAECRMLDGLRMSLSSHS